MLHEKPIDITIHSFITGMSVTLSFASCSFVELTQFHLALWYSLYFVYMS